MKKRELVGGREAGFDGFPTPARALGSRGGQYLPLWGRVGSGRGGRRRLPVIGLEVVQLVKFEADVLDRELQQVPETSQVLSCGPRVGIHILQGEVEREREREMGEQNQVFIMLIQTLKIKDHSLQPKRYTEIR